MKKRIASWFFVVLAFSICAPAQAQTRCSVSADGSPALADVDASARISFLRNVMRDQARRGRLWMTGWIIGGFGLSAGSFGMAAITDSKEDRFDSIVSGFTSLTIPLGIFVKPLRVVHDHEVLETSIDQTTTTLGAMSPCLQIARAEELLGESADDEALGYGIFAHGFAVIGNGAVAAFLGFGFQHWKGAALNGIGGFLITEAQIFTQPKAAVRAREEYKRGDLSRFYGPPQRAMTWGLAPLSVAGAQGVAVVGTF